MDSFDQLIELTHEARTVCTNFLSKKNDVSVKQAFMDFLQSEEICKEIENKMKKVEMKKEGSGYGYDNCVYYMAKDWLHQYQYATLLVFTAKLGASLKQQAENKAREAQKESLKQLIKEVMNEAKEEEKKLKPTINKKQKSSSKFTKKEKIRKD